MMFQIAFSYPCWRVELYRWVDGFYYVTKKIAIELTTTINQIINTQQKIIS